MAAQLGSRGGHRRTVKPDLPLKQFPPPRNLSELAEQVAQTIADVRSRLIEGNANSVAILAGTLLNILKTSDLEKRMAAIEAADSEIRGKLDELRRTH